MWADVKLEVDRVLLDVFWQRADEE